MGSSKLEYSRTGNQGRGFGLRLLFVVVTAAGFLIFYLKEPENILCSPSLLAIVVCGVLCCAAIGNVLFDSFAATVASALGGGAIWLGILVNLTWTNFDLRTFAIHCLVVMLTTAFLALSVYPRTPSPQPPAERHTSQLIAFKEARASGQDPQRTESETHH